MDDLLEARQLMEIVASQTPQQVDATTAIQMAKVWAHIALAEAARQQTALLERIATALESRGA